MDVSVYGKILTLHPKGNRVDVEALRDRIPLRHGAGTGPQMGSHGYRRFRRWTSVFMDAYVGLGIYGNIQAKELGREDQGGGGTRVGVAPSVLVAASWLLRLHLQVSWLSFGPSKIISKVLFHLDSVWYSFFVKLKNKEKTGSGIGLQVNRLVPKII